MNNQFFNGIASRFVMSHNNSFNSSRRNHRERFHQQSITLKSPYV
nr:MAG TPA_asm: hypothetical protein [Caudoviricetes sp.]